MKWQDASEIVCGFVLELKLDPNAVSEQDVWPEYLFIIKMSKDGAERKDMVAVNFSAVDACLHASERVNGTLKTPLEYVDILRSSALADRTAREVEKMRKQLELGNMVTPAELMALAFKVDTGFSRFVPMSQIEPQKVKFIKTGYAPLDDNTGGVPHACVTIIASNPGVGKTTLGLKIVSSMIRRKENKKKKGLVLTLEMTMGQVHQRYIEIDSSLTDADKDRILLGRIFNIYEMAAAVTQLAAQEDLCVVMIDFADLLVEGEQSESAMGVIYKELELLATKTEVPIILIAQLNRATYESGMPRIHHIRYSGLAEATARLILLIYNPNSVFVDFTKKEDCPLTPVPGRGYIIVGKSNFGYKMGSPGGIQVDWDGEAGWGDKSYMYVKLQSV